MSGAESKPTPGRPGPKPGKGKGGIKEGSSGGFRCRVNIDCKQVFGPTRRTRAEAEADLRIATDRAIPVAERLAALRSPRAHKPKDTSASEQSTDVIDSGGRPLTPSETIHCLDAPTAGSGLARCGSDQSRPLLVTGVTSQVNCIGCLRLLVGDRLCGMAAKVEAPEPGMPERPKS